MERQSPKNPVQVLLNTNDFIRFRDKGRGGLSTDFYGGRDAEFVRHKKAVKDQVEAVYDAVAQSGVRVAYAKVVLEQKAWAKSNRPVEKLFAPDRTPLVGALDLGQLILEVTPAALRQVVHSIDAAESTTKYAKPNPKFPDAKRPFNPSRERSEVGAIATVELFAASDKRRFGLHQAIEWLSDTRTGSTYEAELFTAPPADPRMPASTARRDLFKGFVDNLNKLNCRVATAAPRLYNNRTVFMRLERGPKLAHDNVRSMLAERGFLSVRESDWTFDDSPVHHANFLAFLDDSPLVRRVDLSPIILRTEAAAPRSYPISCEIPTPGASFASHPVVGVLDGGIAPILDPWLIGQWGLVADPDRDEDHGTFIGGLLTAGQSLNGSVIAAEADGCRLFDFDVMPAERPGVFQRYFPNGTMQLFDEVDEAVRLGRAQGIRVFNFSLNVCTPVSPDSYSRYAQRMDEIADEHDAIIVLSAGNFTNPSRPEWVQNPVTALANLVSTVGDGLFVPSESLRNLTVAATNPPGVQGTLHNAPAAYSRRGPGSRTALKPDLAHYGGALSSGASLGTGLFSVHPDGTVADQCGTSYAAPLVAKTLAALDAKIYGDAERETLIAMLVNFSSIRTPLDNDAYKQVARNYVGFGHPASSDEMLLSDDHSITLVFNDVLKNGKLLRFPFTWPRGLVTDSGKCRGDIRMTLVYRPPLDYGSGSELIRVSLDAALKQEHNGKFADQLEPVHKLKAAKRGGSMSAYEYVLISEYLKWSPIKVYERHTAGIGTSSNWRLDVNYLQRSAVEPFPEAGIPFSVVLTIGDPDGVAPVFNEVRQSLQTSRGRLADIRTAQRVRQTTR